MGWVRRLRNRADAPKVEIGVAADFADFLAHATERGALAQAIVEAQSQSQRSELVAAQREAQGTIVAEPVADRGYVPVKKQV
jgi:hypothetical protein